MSRQMSHAPNPHNSNRSQRPLAKAAAAAAKFSMQAVAYSFNIQAPTAADAVEPLVCASAARQQQRRQHMQSTKT